MLVFLDIVNKALCIVTSYVNGPLLIKGQLREVLLIHSFLIILLMI